MITILHDTDNVVWRAACTVWDYRTDTVTGTLDDACIRMHTMLHYHRKFIERRFNIEKVEYHVTSDDKSNFRFFLPLETPYKGNRYETKRPPFLADLKLYLVQQFNASISYGEEADDTVGIKAMNYDPENVMIVSPDKDMNMIPGLHWQGDKEKPIFLAKDPGWLMPVPKFDKDGKVKRVIYGAGLKWFYYQLCVGDVADNIKRPWRYKSGELQKVVNTLNTMPNESALFTYVLGLYIRKGSTLAKLVENAQMLWIRRKEGEIWSVPNF